MKRSLSFVKTYARTALSSRWGAPVLAVLLLLLLSWLSSRLSSAIIFSNVNGFTTLSGYIVAFIFLLLLDILSAGLTAMGLTLLRGEKASAGEILSAFKNHPDRFLIAGLLKFLAAALYLLPLFLIFRASGLGSTLKLVLLLVWGIAGGLLLIRFYLSWSFVRPLLLEDSSLSSLEAFRQSSAMTRGQLLRLFGFELSFLGWYLLGLLSLGLGFLWIIPYVATSRVALYLSVSEGR